MEEGDPPAGGAQATAEDRSPEAQAEAALALLDDVARVTADPTARAEVNPLSEAAGVMDRLDGSDPAVKGKKRVVQRLASGRMVFGDGPLPVPLFGKDNVEDGPHGCGGRIPAPRHARGTWKRWMRRAGKKTPPGRGWSLTRRLTWVIGHPTG